MGSVLGTPVYGNSNSEQANIILQVGVYTENMRLAYLLQPPERIPHVLEAAAVDRRMTTTKTDSHRFHDLDLNP